MTEFLVKGQLKFLGTGGSMGIPVIGCPCPICKSSDPHNKRLRPSALLTVENKTLLFDCGPDFRQQALNSDLNHLDGVILTHAHEDHTGGLDDLRIFFLKNKQPIPTLASEETIASVEKRFDYMFNLKSEKGALIARLDFQKLIGQSGLVSFQGVDFEYFSYYQMGMKVNGFRSGGFAYVTDIKDFDPSIYPIFDEVETLVISALRFTGSAFHFTIDDAIAFARNVGAKKTYLNHIAHEIDHLKTNAYLPPEVRLSFDGLEVDVNLQLSGPWTSKSLT